MDNLPFQNEELDLIWSEGAIYNIGFERGINEWNRFLKKDGFIAVTEASWFTPERPAEIEDFWLANYPEIDTIPTPVPGPGSFFEGILGKCRSRRPHCRATA